MENLIRIYTKNDAISVLIRHSDRYCHSVMDNPRLNPQGIIKAIELGRRFSNYKINKIITTDVDRCYETAERIKEGHGGNIVLERSKNFGKLYYVDCDRDTAKEFLKQYGYDKYHELYKRMISGIDTPGICGVELYKKLMDDFIIDNTVNHGITVFVTHDINIAYYHFGINKTTYERLPDVENLCGILLCNGRYVSDFQAEV